MPQLAHSCPVSGVPFESTSAPHSRSCFRRSIPLCRPQQPRRGKRCARVPTACLPSQLTLLADVSIDVLDPSTAKTVATFLQPVLATSILLMFVRVPLSWYPNIDVKKLPWIIAVLPTEPVLGPTRKIVQPQGGVDLAPLVWVAVLSFINEILLGPQGILNLLQRKAEL